MPDPHRRCGPADPDAPITIATIPVGDDPTAENPIEVFGALLEEATGREVEITDVPDYLSVVEAIRADHVDIGIMSGFPSALAVNTGEVDALVAFEGDGKPVSTCVVLADSPVQTLEDLAGKTVAFADQASSSGYFMPVYMLHEAGLEQGDDYEAIFAGGHEGSFAALEQGQVDAACTAVMLTELGAPMFPFADGEWRAVGESPAMDVAGAVLGRPRSTPRHARPSRTVSPPCSPPRTLRSWAPSGRSQPPRRRSTRTTARSSPSPRSRPSRASS